MTCEGNYEKYCALTLKVCVDGAVEVRVLQQQLLFLSRLAQGALQLLDVGLQLNHRLLQRLLVACQPRYQNLSHNNSDHVTSRRQPRDQHLSHNKCDRMS